MKEKINKKEDLLENKERANLKRQQALLEIMQQRIKRLEKQKAIQIARIEESKKNTKGNPKILAEREAALVDMINDIATITGQVADTKQVIAKIQQSLGQRDYVIKTEEIIAGPTDDLTVDELKTKKGHLQGALREDTPADLASKINQAQDEIDLLIEQKQGQATGPTESVAESEPEIETEDPSDESTETQVDSAGTTPKTVTVENPTTEEKTLTRKERIQELKELIAQIKTEIQEIVELNAKEDRMTEQGEEEEVPVSPKLTETKEPSLEIRIVRGENLTESEVLEILSEWALRGEFPQREKIERGHTHLVLKNSSSPDSPILYLNDSKQIAEFDRIGKQDATEAWLVPNPDARWSPYMWKMFRIKEVDYRAEIEGGRIKPIRLIRQLDGKWQFANTNDNKRLDPNFINS